MSCVTEQNYPVPTSSLHILFLKCGLQTSQSCTTATGDQILTPQMDNLFFFSVKFQRIQKPRTKVGDERPMSTFRLRVVSPQGDWPTSLIRAGHEPAHQVFTTRPLPQASEQEPKKNHVVLLLAFIKIWPAALKSAVQSWGGSRRDEDQQIRGGGPRLEKGQTSLMWWRERE